MKKFLTMALALMMVLSLFAVPTMAATGHYLGEDLLGGKGSFEALEPGSTITNNATDGFATFDATITATVIEEDGNNYVKLTPSNDTRSPSLYITRDTEIAEGSGTYYLPVTPGQRYEITFDAWHNGDMVYTGAWNTLINIDSYYYLADGTQTGLTGTAARMYAGMSGSAFAKGEWASYKYTFVPPAGVAYMRAAIGLPKAMGDLYLDNIEIRTSDEIAASTYGGDMGSFEAVSSNSQWTATGNVALSSWATASSALYKGNEGHNLAIYNNDSNPGVEAYEGQMYIGLGVKSEYAADHATGNVVNSLFFANANKPMLLDYGKTYEISVWFNAANAADSYTGEAGDKPMVPVFIINNTGTSQANRGTQKMAFPDAWQVDGWQKLTWEYTAPAASYYEALTGSGKVSGAMNVGFSCYSSAGTMGYFDNFSVVEKKAAPQPPVVEPTTAAVTGTTNNEAYGTVTPATSTVELGEDVTFTVTPKLGYYVAAATLNGESVLGSFDAYKGGTYTVEEVAEDVTLAVEFAAVTAKGENVATLTDSFVAADSAVTFGKVLDRTDATSWGIELTKDGVGVTPYHGGSYLYKAFATNANGQYAIEFIGLEAGEYTIRSYVYVNGVATFGAPSTFVVD